MDDGGVAVAVQFPVEPADAFTVRADEVADELVAAAVRSFNLRDSRRHPVAEVMVEQAVGCVTDVRTGQCPVEGTPGQRGVSVTGFQRSGPGGVAFGERRERCCRDTVDRVRPRVERVDHRGVVHDTDLVVAVPDRAEDLCVRDRLRHRVLTEPAGGAVRDRP